MAMRRVRPRDAWMLLVAALGGCRHTDCPRLEVRKGAQQVVSAPPPDGPVVTGPALVRGKTARSLTGRIQPHGRPATYYFEYGRTEAYGMATPSRALPPRLAAHYRETWDKGPAGFRHATNAEPSEHVVEPGAAGGFIRHREPTERDANHLDGVGLIHIAHYYHPGTYPSVAPGEQGLWAAGDPDLRDARVRVSVRGRDFQPNGSELVWWSQASLPFVEAEGDSGWRATNWAFTGFSFNDALATGRWESVEYRLANDPALWTYGGYAAYQNRPNYVYAPIDDVLAHLDINFIHALLFVNFYEPPEGAFDFDDFEVTYRNHSVLLASNGGTLRSAPAGSEGAPALTDGWRHGAGKTWRSAPSPSAPQEIVWDLARPVTIERLQVHQDPDWPSKDIEIEASADGVTWTSIGEWTLPEAAPNGPNFAFVHARDLQITAKAVRVRVRSGYKTERWGLGEVEVFGSGAVFETDDDWYNVNADVTGLEPGVTYHCRLVSVSGPEIQRGPDVTFTTPGSAAPVVETLPPRRTGPGSATLEARVVSMGRETNVWFELGADGTCPQRTGVIYAGLSETPRTVLIPVTAQPSGTTLYYRIVAENLSGIARGELLSWTVP
jgi:hypothetical protein